MVDFAKRLNDRKSASLLDFGPGEPPAGTYIISFGKHRGTPINEVERSYLEWMLEQDDMMEKRAGLQEAILAELARRGKEIVKREVERHTPPSRYDELTMEIARMIVEAGAEQLKEQFGQDLAFVAAYTFLKHEIAHQEVADGTLVF